MADIHLPMNANPHVLSFGRPSHATPHGLSFGFGVVSQSHNSSTAINHILAPSPIHVSASAVRSGKRRLDDDEADETMEVRSPTPEVRPRIKRIKQPPASSAGGSSKDSVNHLDSDKANKEHSDDNESDIGMMLAMLPPQALLPLITSLVKSHPHIKPLLLANMPPPSLDSALQALAQATNKLRGAHPYSSNSPPSSAPTTSGFGWGGGGVQQHLASGMRDAYVHSRIAPHAAEFSLTVTSSLPFFSSLQPSPSLTLPVSRQGRPHPTDTFTYLAAVTRTLLLLPQLSQECFRETLIPRLVTEWKGWLHRVDEMVNKEAGMVGLETAKLWASTLEGFAVASADLANGLERLRNLRDDWIGKVGWLAGRSPRQSIMEEEL